MPPIRRWSVTLSNGPKDVTWRSYTFERNKPQVITSPSDAAYFKHRPEFTVREIIAPQPKALGQPEESAEEAPAEVEAGEPTETPSEPEAPAPPRRGRRVATG
jgi:hypothetical protein